MRLAFLRMIPRNSRVVSGFGFGVFDQRLHVALDRGQRRAQFMAHVGDEVAAGFFRGLDARHVVQHGQRAAGGQRRRIDLEDAPRRQRTGAAEAHFAILQRAAHAGQQFGVAHGVNQRTAGANLGSGNALHDRVRPAHLALRG